MVIILKGKRRLIVPGVTLVLLLAGLAWHGWRPRTPEPTFEGKPASFWIARVSTPVEFQPRKEIPALDLAPTLGLSPAGGSGFALEPQVSGPIPNFSRQEHPSFGAFRAMGSNGVSALLEALGSDDPDYAFNAARLLGEIAPIDAPVLNRVARGMFAGEPASHSLYRCFYDRLPALLSRYLTKPDVPQDLTNYFNFRACFRRQGIPSWTRKTEPYLLALFRLSTRRQITGRQPGRADVFSAVVPKLTKSLAARDDRASYDAALALKTIGSPALEAGPALLTQFGNSRRHPFLRAVYIKTLLEVGFKTNDPTGTFLTAVADTNRIVRCAALAGMRICPSPGITNCLWKMTAGKDLLLQRMAYDSLRSIDPEQVATVAPPTYRPRPGNQRNTPWWETDSLLYDYLLRKD